MSVANKTTEPVLPPWSSYAGEPFNLTERRPLKVVAESDVAIVAEGFFHFGAFWRAVFPKRGVVAIVGQRLNFSKPRKQPDGSSKPSLFFLNHVQARVLMNPDTPVELYALDDEEESAPAHRIVDFSYSVEAVGPHGRRWNTADAMLGNLALVHRFLSTEEVVFERIVRGKMSVVQSPPLPLEAELLDTMLHEAIRESSKAGLSRPYFMFRLPLSAANCTSEPLRLLDDVLRTGRLRRRFYRFPVHPRAYLKLRGLWQSGQTVPTLNEQMAEWLESDQSKNRWRLHAEMKKKLPPRDRTKRPTWLKSPRRLWMAWRR